MHTEPRASDAGEYRSALWDAQADESAVHAVLADPELTDRLCADWHTYRLIGQALRAELSPRDLDSDAAFLSRFRHAVQHSQADAVVPGLSLGLNASPVEAAPVRPTGRRTAANAPRWQWVAGVAVVAIGVWASARWLPTDEAGGAFAASEGQFQATAGAETVSGSGPVMWRNAELDALLDSHRRFGGMTALQAPAGFVRDVTHDEGAGQ